MKFTFKKLLFLSLFISVLSNNVNATPATSKSLTYQQFGHLPLIQYSTVSPDGQSIAALYNAKDGPMVVLSAFGSSKISGVAKLKKSKDRIDGIRWVNNERLIISASYSKNFRGDRIRINRLFAVNKDGSNFILLQRREVRKQPAWMDYVSSSRIVSQLTNDKEHVLIELYDEKDRGWSVFKVNIYTNEFTKLFVNDFEVNRWYANNKGEVVFGVGHDQDVTTIWYRKSTKDQWKKLHTRKAFHGETFNPVIVKDDKVIVMSDYDLHRKALWQYDIKSGEFDKLIYAHEKYDLQNAILSPDGTEVIGATYADNFQKSHYFNVEDATLNRIVKKSFKQYNTFIVDFSNDRKKVLVLAQRADSPSKYFWLDLQKKTGGFWFSQYPDLEKQQLAKVQPFEFTNKAGVNLNGYLTLPVNLKKGEKPPLIVHPHGGPQGRDYQYFNPYVQYLTHLGYAVLQVNFRGSVGFGNNYEVAGYRQWGKLMQQDVYDAIDWLRDENKVNVDNSCIVGASYGGYVALTAAFQKPELFKCIVSIAGIADLSALATGEYQYPTQRAFVRETIGDPTNADDIKMMEKVSAINYVDEITAPILLIHGTNDTQVRYKQSVDFYKRAKKSGVDVNYVELVRGTHYLDGNDNRLEAFKVLGDFLRKNLH